MNSHAVATDSRLIEPDTPFAVLDLTRAQTNSDRLTQKLKELGVSVRPHVKTAKSIPVAELMQNGQSGPITVSTLHEAEVFVGAGYRDITYAVGVDPESCLELWSWRVRVSPLTSCWTASPKQKPSRRPRSRPGWPSPH